MINHTTLIDMNNWIPLNNEGKNSSVYTFTDPQLGSDFIAKKIDKSTIKNIDELFNESKILYEVKHPNIMEIQYASYDDNNIFIVMPKCKKGSIQSLLCERYLTVREILKYSLEFLTGLQYVHAHNLIHYDIKPTNILINNNGKAILTDFGLAKYMNKVGLATQLRTYITEMPPEKYISSKTSMKCDIYQAGLTMYRMCNGNKIWDQQLQHVEPSLKEATLKGKFPDRNFYLPHIPLQLKKVINKCIMVDPDKRYNNVLEIINALSIIDKNLTWEYSEKDNYRFWSRINKTGTHKEIIKYHENGNTYEITGEKMNIKSKKTINISKWAYSDTNKNKTIKKLTVFLKD